jgi:hypothetical protein
MWIFDSNAVEAKRAINSMGRGTFQKLAPESPAGCPYVMTRRP